MLFWLNVEEAGNASWVGQVRCLEHYRLSVDKSDGLCRLRYRYSTVRCYRFSIIFWQFQVESKNNFTISTIFDIKRKTQLDFTDQYAYRVRRMTMRTMVLKLWLKDENSTN